MSTLAFVFPGQGSQAVGMGRVLAEASPAAAAIFGAADDALGESLSRLAWEGPAEELDLTVNAQPALLAASIAFLRPLAERRAAAGRPPLAPAFVAGQIELLLGRHLAAWTLQGQRERKVLGRQSRGIERPLPLRLGSKLPTLAPSPEMGEGKTRRLITRRIH